jgi:hypothetical protein
MTISIGKLKLDRLLLSLVIIQIIIDLPFFFDLVPLEHDTQYAFQWFYLSYNDLFFFNELPRWVPFGFYGVQSDYFALMPTDYLCLFIGKVLGIQNVLSVYKVSIFLQQIIFFFGTYLLSRKLFNRGVTVFIVCVIAICSTVFYFQLHQNFVDFMYLPLILYFILKFFSDHKLQNLFIMLNILIFSLFGIGVYLATLPALVVTIFFIVMLIANIKKWRSLIVISKRDIIISGFFLLTFIALLFTYYSFITNALEFTEGTYIGRDPVTKVSYLESFLTYIGHTIGFEKFKGLVYPSLLFVIGDITMHVGFLTLFFIGYTFIFVRNSVFLALTAVVTVFVLFSLGSMTPVAEFLYNYFPTMKYYRHVGHSVANLKLFMPLMAGFGIDHLLGRLEAIEEGSEKRELWSLILKILVAVVVLAGSIIYSRIVYPDWLVLWVGITVVFLVALYFFHTRFHWTTSVGFFIAACVLFQMLSYRVLVDGFYSRTFKFNTPKEITYKVNKYLFQPERLITPTEGRALETFYYTYGLTVTYSLAYNFIQFDPCVSEFRNDFLNSNVTVLLRLKGAELRKSTIGPRLILPDDKAFLRTLGCFSPKLKLFSDALFFDDTRAAQDFIRREPDIDKMLVLSDVPVEEQNNSWSGASRENDGKGTIMVSAFSANEIELDVKVSSEGGQWLYYADAWHPGWKAYVNGIQRPIARANIAFKAVRLASGENKVRFVFENKKSRMLLNLIIFYDILIVPLLLIFFCRSLFWSILPFKEKP